MNEKQFLLQALKEDQRLDGREFDNYRKLDLQFGDEHGVADLRLGQTRYVFWGCIKLKSTTIEHDLS